LFNSYYNTVGDQYPRHQRGLLSRPTVAEVKKYRRLVDQRIVDHLCGDGSWSDQLSAILELGLHHEQQHQELMLTDLKHLFSCNPLYPATVNANPPVQQPPPQRWIDFPSGLHQIGHDGNGFAFDNESPQHRVFVEPYQLSNRLVTNGEYLQFIEDDGYRRPEFWLSLGWSHINDHQWTSPLYWHKRDEQWYEFTLGG
jgi:ergothioneine biosynthesis protein EgtB